MRSASSHGRAGIAKITTALPLAALAFKVARNPELALVHGPSPYIQKIGPSLEGFRGGKVFNQPLTHTRKE